MSKTGDVTIVWKDPQSDPDADEGRAVWVCSDGVVGVGYAEEPDPTRNADPQWVNFTRDEWGAIVEATRDVWEKEDPAITRMRADVESIKARGEAVPFEIVNFLRLHPAR